MELISRHCPVCGSESETSIFAPANFDPSQLNEYAFASRKIPEYMHYQLISCGKCDLLYASPVPQQEALSEAYHVAAFDSSEEAHYASQIYAQLLQRLLPRLPDRVGVLDIGTGDGAFLEQLLSLGFSSVMGVEPSAAPIAVAKANIRPLIRPGIFEVKAFEPEQFSLITCFQTLEHLSDPLALVRDAYHLLKPGGAVFFVCHNRRAFSARLLATKSPIFDIEHLQLFSPQSATYLLQEAGFRQVEFRRVFNRYPLHYWVKLFPMPLILKRFMISSLKKLKLGYLPVTLPAGNLAIMGYK
jgi:SAM-dependent methyltransferase